MSTVIRVNDSTRRFWTTLPIHPVSLRLVDTSLTNQQIANPERKIVGNLTFVSMEKLETTAGARKVVNDLV